MWAYLPATYAPITAPAVSPATAVLWPVGYHMHIGVTQTETVACFCFECSSTVMIGSVMTKLALLSKHMTMHLMTNGSHHVP